MRLNSLSYMLREAFKSVFKQRKMSSASIAIMIATMFIFGIFFVLGENINFVMEQVENKQGMRVVIKDDVEEYILEGLKSKIQNIEIDGKKVVNTVTFVSKEDAMKSIKERLGDKQDVLEGLDEENFLPASYFVTLTDLSKNQQVQDKQPSLNVKTEGNKKSKNIDNSFINVKINEKNELNKSNKIYNNPYNPLAYKILKDLPEAYSSGKYENKKEIFNNNIYSNQNYA